MIGMPQANSRVARTKEDLSAPIHLPDVQPLDINKVIPRMNASTRARFLEVWNLTTRFDPKRIVLDNPMPCPSTDAATAVKNGIAVPLPKGTPVTCHSFSILEENKVIAEGVRGNRRRDIKWARAFNAACADDGYKARVNLKHHSAYFARVHQAAGACFDLRAGFYQVRLPRSDLFTFADEHGNVFGLDRLPMGISTAPEIMQVVTSTLAGDPLFCTPACSAPALVDVWIDNVLYTGSTDKVKRSTESFRKAVAEVKATINVEDSTECTTEVEFIGMKFDFVTKKIGLSDKNAKKVKLMDFTTGDRLRISDLETATARLMYASSVLGVRMAKYYYAIKFLRRKLSELNRETAVRNDIVVIPPSSLSAFRRWHKEVLSTEARVIPNLVGRKRYTLYVDASLTGWGAVLINEETQQMFVVAGRWSAEDALRHINVLEGRGVVLALQRFDMIDGAIIQPRIDNTSVVGSLRKGMSNSADLSEQIKEVDDIIAERDIVLLAPIYVRSKDNLADFWSRLPVSEADVPTHILARNYIGGLAIKSIAPSPS